LATGRWRLRESITPGLSRPGHTEMPRDVDRASVRCSIGLANGCPQSRGLLAALDSVDENLSEEQRREDLYLSALAHYVGAVGGRLEVRAVFGDEEIVVSLEPDVTT
jgi:hypothetical protein